VLDRHVERLFAIERGRASASVTPMTDPASTFQFATPGAVTSVRGTRFRMSYDADAHRATSEVLEGKVGFDPQGRAAQVLPAGFGSASDLDEPVALLPPPRLVEAGAPQTAEALRFAWQPLPGARAYRVQIAADAQFLKVLDETVATDPAAQFAALPDGHSCARRAWTNTAWKGSRRSQTLNGAWKTACACRWKRAGTGRCGNMCSTGTRRTTARPAFASSWPSPAGKSPMIDRPDLTSHALVGLALPAGRYRWRVLMEEMVDGKPVSRWSDYQDVRIEASW
jgi:hypothetical protein